MSSHTRRIALIGTLTFSLLIATGAVMAQDEFSLVEETPPLDCPPSETTGCAIIYLSPETLTGDFYLGEEPLALGQNPALLNLPASTSSRIDVRNIQDTAEGFGTLYVYKDTSATIWLNAGQTRETTLFPQKSFIRGTLHLTCTIQNPKEGDDVACQVTIDDIPQETLLPLDGEADYILEPGPHQVTVTLVGEQAYLWSPASQSHTAYVYKGVTRNVTSRFYKAGYLTLTLEQLGVLADFYDNDELVAEQVNTTALWVEPNKTHRLTATNFTDPDATDLYTWKDATRWVYIGAGQEKSVVFSLKKRYLKGFLSLTCNIRVPQPDEYAYCQPSIDGTDYDPILPGQTVEYTLEPGRYSVVVKAGPPYAWTDASLTFSPTIYAGRTYKRTITFNLQRPEPSTIEAFAWPFLAAIADRGPDYADDFSNPGSGWATSSYDNADPARRVGYLDGEFFASLVPTPGAHNCSHGENRSMPYFRDLVLEVDGRFVVFPPNGNQSWHLAFRWGAPANNDPARGGGYVVMINPLQNVALSRGIWLDNNNTHLGGVTSNYIARGSGTNHLQVVAKGSEIAIMVNGVPLLYADDPGYEGYFGGGVTMSVCTHPGEPLEARWDNLRIWDISGF